MSLPLDGVVVLDLSRVLSGPFATLQLADLGARILKVEEPTRGDDTRGFGPPFVGGEATYFLSVNRGKESLVLDLKRADHRAALDALVEHVDVVVENFRPGTLARLGVSFDAWRARDPALVTCSISGYGATGDPRYVERAGYDAIIQAGSGLMALTGAVDGPPARFGVAIADLVTGLYAAQGILAALVRRGASGVGGHVELSMQDAMAAMLTYQAGISFATGASPPRLGDAHPSICPYESVATADGAFMLAVGNDALFRRFAALIGHPGLADEPRFATNRDRVAHRAALMAIVGPAMRLDTTMGWDRRFAEAGVPGGPIATVAEALAHPQLAARGSIVTHAHETAGEVRSIRSPVVLDGARLAAPTPPPRLGEHHEAVFRSLGLDAPTRAGGPPSPSER